MDNLNTTPKGRRLLVERRIRALLAVCWLIATLDSFGQGLLVRHPTNPRYFAGADGNPIYLTGSHTWDNFQDWGGSKSNFNFASYLNLLTTKHHNFVRLWRWEAAMVDTGIPGFILPQPWQRTGPGLANDGLPRFDLTKFDQSYFDRLRDRLIAARDQGIYVSIMLFQEYIDWSSCPLNGPNNINGINAGSVTSVHTLTNAAVLPVQEAYVRKVVDTINGLDNVLYEIGNEMKTYTVPFQYHMIDLIHSYEAGKPKRHPVGMTSGGFGSSSLLFQNSVLFASNADWISPSTVGGEDYANNPPVGFGSKVILADTDHIGGVLDSSDPAVYRRWIWKCLLRGLNPILMDAVQNGIPGWDGYAWNNTNNPGLLAARNYMGQARQFAEKISLASAMPQGALSSTTFCLADPGQEYVVYQPVSATAFTVNLLAGTFDFEWFNPTTGLVASTGSVTVAGGNRSFTAPFSGDAVLFLKANFAATTPTIQQVSAVVDPNQIRVIFNEPVDPATVEPAANYAVDNGVVVTAASLLADGRTVMLQTTPLFENVTYNLAVNGVRDLSGDSVAPNTMRSFAFLSLRTGLAAQWKFDETNGLSVYDSSGNAYHGTLSGATRVPGRSQNGLEFDGINDSVPLGTNGVFQLTSAFTLAAWIKTGTPGRRILVRRDPVDWRFVNYILMFDDDGRVNFHFVNTLNDYVASFTTTAKQVNDNQWHHVSVSYDGIGVKLYVDGMLEAVQEGTGTPKVRAAVELNLGKDILEANQGASAGWFQGTLDEVRIYNRALSAVEVAAVMNTDRSLPALNPVLGIRCTGDYFVLSWPVTESPFSLERTTSLGLPFAPFTHVAATNTGNGMITVTLPLLDQQVFYHLKGL